MVHQDVSSRVDFYGVQVVAEHYARVRERGYQKQRECHCEEEECEEGDGYAEGGDHVGGVEEQE